MAACSRASAQSGTLPTVTDDKVETSQNVEVYPARIEASVTPRRVRVSRNGKNCHQCRQTMTDRVASCKNVKGKRRCHVNICRKCLLNRYAEDVDQVSNSTDWSCPKCRNICNCSVCRRKKGYAPTGILAPEAKRRGLSSVHELIASGDPGLTVTKNNVPSQEVVLQKREHGEASESSLDYITEEERTEKKFRLDNGDREVLEDNRANGSNESSGHDDEMAESKSAESSKSLHKNKFSFNHVTAAVTRPQEKELVRIGHVDFPHEEVGQALQYCAFCKAFHKFFGTLEAHGSLVFWEMIEGRNSLAVDFLLKLLSLLQMNVDPEKDGNSWKEILLKCISRSEHASKYFQDCMDSGRAEFDELDIFKKLRLLNFLCDEALGSEALRNWIDEEAEEFIERKKGAKKEVVAAKEKVCLLNKEMEQLEAKIAQEKGSKNGDSHSISENENTVSQLKLEAKKAHLEKLEAVRKVPKTKQADALRTEPIITDESGRVFWRLESFSSEGLCFMLQELGDTDVITPQDKWYTFDMKDQKKVQKYTAFLRKEQKKSERCGKVVPQTDGPVKDEPENDSSHVM